METFTIRVARESDAKAVQDIYRYYVEQTTITFDFHTPSVEQFVENIVSGRQDYPFLVCEKEGEVVGYCYAHQFRERPAFTWSAELSIYIAHHWHGKGLGRRLYDYLIMIVKKQNVRTIYALIESSNTTSLRMHERFGFESVGVLKNTGFKLGRWLDLVVMDRKIGDYCNPPLPFIPFSKLNSQEKECVIEL